MHFDLCIIGGGINGVGVAREATLRGLSVVLLESGDLACATSSASTKLIHGGLRYLEHGEFTLVRKSLKERETLIRMAPHLVKPLEFVLPHVPAQRPFPVIRAGLFLYDFLAGRKVLKRSRPVQLQDSPYGDPLMPDYFRGFIYMDCWTDDARLVILNAQAAAERGASIRNYSQCMGLASNPSGWTVRYKDTTEPGEKELQAKMIVNATGPWARKLLEASGLTEPDMPSIRLLKGSHIVVPKQFTGSHAYIVQQPDGRIVFAIPYQSDFTLIGTTEVPFEGDPADSKISDEECHYLCEAFNRFFRSKIKVDDIVWNFSGVRPLFDDGQSNASKVTRDYRLHIQGPQNHPLLSILGGKLTTYRPLAKKVIDEISKYSGISLPESNRLLPLPGGNFEESHPDAFLSGIKESHSWLHPSILERQVASYGTNAFKILGNAHQLSDLGSHFGAGLYESEIRYLIQYEWARKAEDILWRRTKLGLSLNETEVQTLSAALPAIVSEVLNAPTNYPDERRHTRN